MKISTLKTYIKIISVVGMIILFFSITYANDILKTVKVERIANGSIKETGAGFFVSKDGLIITAAHVLTTDIDEKLSNTLNKQIRVKRRISPGVTNPSIHNARILSLNRILDLALIKIELSQPVPYFKYSDIELSVFNTDPPTLRIIGHPKVNGRREEWDTSLVHINRISEMGKIILNDPIYSGHSGGPAIDGNGKVVGICSFLDAGLGQSGIIPIDDAKILYEQKNWKYAFSIGSPSIINSNQLNVFTLAKTPGIVVVTIGPNNFKERAIIQGFVRKGNSGPVTLRASDSVDIDIDVHHASFSMPVSKGESWMVKNGGGILNSATILWYPLDLIQEAIE